MNRTLFVLIGQSLKVPLVHIGLLVNDVEKEKLIPICLYFTIQRFSSFQFRFHALVITLP